MQPRNVIIRHSAPCSLDEADYGSICIAKDSSTEIYKLYLQVNIRSHVPQWEILGEFNSNTPQEHIESIINKRLQE